MVMVENLVTQLIELGFSDKEARVYFALLELGSASPAEVARRSGVKRSTTYVLLEELEQKGLVRRSPKGRRTVFSLDDPDKLTELIESRARLVQTIAPLLSTHAGAARQRPRVNFYEGATGVIRVYRMWQRKAKQKDAPKEIIWYGSLAELEKQFEGELDRCYEVWDQQKISVRELIGATAYEKRFVRKHAGKNRVFRHLPKSKPIAIDFGIYGNQVAIFQLRRNPFVLVIESTDVAEAFRILFDLAWLQSFH